MSVLDAAIEETPVAVLDFETTGLSHKTGARVIEVAVVRVEGGSEPNLTLDTLVDPDGPVHATRIHGITDDDVLGAPLFSDLAGPIAKALEGAVVAAFNASFDIRFLEAELQRFPRGRAAWTPPHVCLMYMRPTLGLGGRCSLGEACAAHGLTPTTHRAADDAFAAAHLWMLYRATLLSRGSGRFRALQGCGYKFAQSLGNPPFTNALTEQLGGISSPTALKPRPDPVFTATGRQAEGQAPPPMADRRRRYWHALIDALSDGRITSAEIASLREEQRIVELPAPDVRAMHGRLAGEVLATLTADDVVTAEEARAVGDLFEALRLLGWAPGDSV